MDNESETEWFIILDKGEEFNSQYSMEERNKKGTHVKFHNKSGLV